MFLIKLIFDLQPNGSQPIIGWILWTVRTIVLFIIMYIHKPHWHPNY